MIIGHQKQWNFLKKKFELNQLSHAYLFTGPGEIGKKRFALDFIKLINCLGEKGKPAFAKASAGGEECQNCKLIEQKKHPDLLMITPKDSGEEIQISQIREVQQFLSLKPYYCSFKVVLVDEAEKMNQEAQSCFLKTLEEPKGNTLLILISERPETIMPTILSRCQTIKFFNVSRKEIKDCLAKKGASEKKSEELSGACEGKPGRAIKLFEDSEKMENEKKLLGEIQKLCDSDLALRFKYAKDLPEGGYSEAVNAFSRYFRQILLLKIGINNFSESDYFPLPSEKLKFYSLLKIKQIIKLAETISSRLRSTNINPKLALETLLLEL